MELALVRPTDDDDIVEALLVQHPNPTKKFSVAWEKAVAGVKKSDPENWNVADVFRVLRNNEWEIFHFNPITVGY